MSGFLLGILSAFWFGILTSISPCPMATNITAISYLAGNIGNTRKVLFNGLLYTLGRTLTYLVLGILMVYSLINAPLISHFFQKYINLFLGPILILVGMVLLQLISFGLNIGSKNQHFYKKIVSKGVLGSGLLGILFALSFCPTSAALFFGSLMTVAVKYKSGIVIPVIYGIATGLPVTLFAIVIAMGTNKVGIFYNKLNVFEKWARRITGVVFIVVGIYFCLTIIFGIHLF